MIQKIKNQNILLNAFTLIEMMIVLIIIWILLMSTVYLSWEQIQKVKDKTVKESILAEMQSRYSRNLWSSSFAGMIYDTMDITFSTWENKIDFTYNAKNSEGNSIKNKCDLNGDWKSNTADADRYYAHCGAWKPDKPQACDLDGNWKFNTADEVRYYAHCGAWKNIVTENKENSFSDRFEIKYIAKNYGYNGDTLDPTEGITLKYSPYQMSCKIWGDENNKNVVIIARVNDNKIYCFEIAQKNCRLVAVSEEKCCKLEILAGLDNNCN